MKLEEIRAQDAAVATLRRALTAGKVPHAYLFVGPGGVGKKLAARGLALALNCSGGADGGVCLSCTDCRKIIAGTHPDVFEIGRVEGKTRIPIDIIRDMERRLSIPAHEGRAKVAVIDDADAMSEPAANALLKTLEEPRAGSYLVLLTSRASSLLPTVRSRCQLVRFRPLPPSVVAELLVEQGARADEAEIVSAFAAGSMAQAKSYLGEDLGPRVEAVLDLLKAAVEPTPLSGLARAEALRRDRVEVLAVLDLTMQFVEEVLFILAHQGSDRLSRPLAKRFSAPFSELTSRLDLQKVARFVTAIEEARTGIERNNMNSQLALERMLMTMRGRV